MTDSVLVIGADELGLAVLEALVTHPKRNHTKISVLLRQATLDSAAPRKRKVTQQITALGVAFETADVVRASASELAAVFCKYDTVVCCTGMGLPSGTQTKLAQAALEASSSSNLRRYFPWQFGMDYDEVGLGSSQDLFDDEQLGVREVLRGQDTLEWVIVSTGLFTSFLFNPDLGVVDLGAKTVRALGSWDNSITVTTPADIGRATAEVVLDPRGVGNQAVYVAGDTITYAQLADLLDERFAGGAGDAGTTRFRRELWGVEELRRQMEEDPGSMVKYYRDTFARGRGKTVNCERGMEMTDVRAYLCGSGSEAMDAKLGEQ